jgi:hypothetical protein
MAVIQALFVYPIKGCMGVPVQTAAVTKTGQFVANRLGRGRHTDVPLQSLTRLAGAV